MSSKVGRRPRVFPWIACLWIACSWPAVAPAAEPVLGADEALRRALERNPDLAAADHRVALAGARAREAGLRPAPELGLEVENVLGQGARNGVDAAETTLTLGVPLDGRRRGARLAVAAAELDGARLEARLARLEVAAETARRYVQVLDREHAVRLAADAARVGEETLEAVRQRVAAARAPDAEAARAEAEVHRLRLAAEHAEHELVAARLRLAAQWGDTRPDFVALRGALLEPAPPEDVEVLAARLDGNGELARLEAERALREAELELAATAGSTPPRVGAGVRRFEDGDDHALVLGFSWTLPQRERRDAALAAGRARRDATASLAAAARVRIESELRGLHQEINHAWIEFTGLRDEVEPRIASALAQTRVAYERGRYGYVEWAAAQRELIEVRAAMLAAATQIHLTRIELARLTGRMPAGLPGEAP